jgi:branched-chain amino acid transport system permease protein
MKLEKNQTIMIGLIGLMAFFTVLFLFTPPLLLTQLSQVVLSGTLVGGLYALVAAGLGLIFGVMKILNICHGEFVILGAYLTYTLFTASGLDPFLSIPISMSVLFVSGFIVHRFLLKYFGPEDHSKVIMITIALSVGIQGAITLIWTSSPKGIFTSYTGLILPIGELIIPLMRLLVLGLAIITIVSLWAFLKYTRFGKAVRATAQDAEVASLVGVSVDRINSISYGIGIAIAGIGGPLIALLFGFNPTTGPLLLLKGLTVIVLGGVGSTIGIIFGGLAVGAIESTGSFFIGGGNKDAIAYTLFLLILLIRPHGFLSKYRTF